ncbi:MAG: DegT/DnrJ/EryC1/StrS family aminotransferase [Gammaproteobacteria bacterium]
MKVPFLDLKATYLQIQDELEEAILNSTRSGQYIGGEVVESFEKNFSNYVSSKYCIGVGNGLDALILSLKILDIGKGDEIIVPANTFIATWLAVSHCGAVPVPVEPDNFTYNIDVKLIESKITKKTKAIIPVHLYGQSADLDEILKLAKKHNLYVIEDAAQAHGSEYKNKRIGGHGDMVAWSFYPGKNLCAVGDGGAITTNNKDFADKLRRYRNYGSSKRYKHDDLGLNSRLDPVQASVLDVKLKYLDSWNNRRQLIADKYNNDLKGLNLILPFVKEHNKSVWHLYCIRTKKRNGLRSKLNLLGIDTLIHYPTPPHMQRAYKYLSYKEDDFPISKSMSSELISLPIGPSLSDEHLEYIISSIKGAI